ncbi:MAG: hypothetical protein P8Z68_02340, partial [Kineosporiaceae bacterium]
LKFTSTRLWWGMLIGTIAVSAPLALVGAALAGRPINETTTPGLDDPATLRSIYTSGLSIAYILTLTIGIITMAGEFRHQTFTATALASPRRYRVVLAKLVTVSLIGAGYGVASVASSVLAALPVVLVRGGSPHLTGDGVPRALALVVLAVALWAVLGLGVGTLIRNQVVALLVAVGVSFLAEPLLSFILQLAGWGKVAQYLPSTATSALISPSAESGNLTLTYLPWWGAALVLLGYAAVSGGIGAALTLRRDIT